MKHPTSLLTRRATIAGAVSLGSTGGAAAADSITKIIVPGSPGSSSDASARLVAEGLSRLRGRQIIIDNRPGAEGRLAGEAFVRSRPGEALMFSVASLVTIVPLMYDNLSFDPAIDMVPITTVHTELMAFIVDPALPVRTMAEFVAYVRSKPPGSLAYHGAPGTPYLAFRAFLKERNLDMLFVNYKSYPQALLDLAAGRITAMLAPVAGTISAVRGGKATLLATSGVQRAPAAAEVATASEQGFPELTIEGMGGLFGWRGIGATELNGLAADIRTIVADPAVREKILSFGALPRDTPSPADYKAQLTAYKELWGARVREFGAQPPG